MWEEWFSPKSIEEALQILHSYKGEARIICGGTDLIPQLKDGTKNVRCLVYIGEIEALRKIEKNGDKIAIGAVVTHTQIGCSALIRAEATLLAEAASAVGSTQIRNIGTVVGNVVNAQPAADTAVALFALGTEAEIETNSNRKSVALEDLYEDIGISKIDSTAEIVTCLRFKSLQGNQGSAFVRLSQRKALALPLVNVAVVVTVQEDNFKEARIVVAPVAPIPFRSKQAEAELVGAPITRNYIERAAEAAMREANPRDSVLRGSKEYRREMVKVLVRRALNQAIQRIRQKQFVP